MDSVYRSELCADGAADTAILVFRPRLCGGRDSCSSGSVGLVGDSVRSARAHRGSARYEGESVTVRAESLSSCCGLVGVPFRAQ